MEAYHNDPMAKFEAVRRLQKFAASGRLVHGYYWNEDQKSGCAVGVLVTRGNHAEFEAGKGHHAEFQAKYGVPLLIADFLERTFEALPLADARSFAASFMQAIPVGSDLTDFPNRLIFEILRQKNLVADHSLEPSAESLKVVRDSFEIGSKMRVVMDSLADDDVKRYAFLVSWLQRRKCDAAELILKVLAKSNLSVRHRKRATDGAACRRQRSLILLRSNIRFRGSDFTTYLRSVNCDW